MTGPNISETRSKSCGGSICSEDEKASFVECVSLEKEKGESNSASGNEKSNVYTKSDTKVTIPKQCRNNFHEQLKPKPGISGLPRPTSSLLRIRRDDGILVPTSLTSKHAQWLLWNDPVFSRRQSFEEHKLCRHIASNTIQDQKSTVASFKRSLQLLGLKDKDLGLNCSMKENKKESKIPRGRATPTFSTQLKQRSVSLTNLRNAVHESGLPTFQAIEKMHRDILTRAVYEEWYFRKQTENRIRKELEDEIQKKRDQELEWIKLERKRRAEENFEKWKIRKSQLQKEKPNEATTKGAKSSPYAKVKPGVEEAFKAWKAKKDEEVNVKADNKKKLEEEERKKNEEKEKKAAGDAAFRAWKQQVDVDLKNKLKAREKEKKVAEEKKEQEIKEKRENAKASYIKWKTDKDKELKQTIKLKRSKSKQMAEVVTARKQEREYEASQAFEEWLDQVEEREDKKCKGKKNSLKSEIPPWYPA